MGVNYFVCTLGQAALPGISRPFQNINQLVDEQASRNPTLPAVGFYAPQNSGDSYDTKVLTFENVLQSVQAVAANIKRETTIEEGQTVGLLSNSSPGFLFTWLALIWLGHPVLLIAPQCSASAIVHLSKACDAPILLHDEAHKGLARDAVQESNNLDFSALTAFSLPCTTDEDVFSLAQNRQEIDVRRRKVSETDVAYLHHTSGTSTGIPKPIPQTHHGGVGALPSLDGSATATFSTTPLYHGGVADLFRAWTSNSMIWLFPSQHAPISAKNIVKCLRASSKARDEDNAPRVAYFSSVPYVLQMMAEDRDGLQFLQEMDLVGVGGAALPPEVGDKLARDDVNLVSRYGSAECGFLMSSHRDYQNDKEWQYVRPAGDVPQLKFEENDDGQSELVITPGWPHMAKTNREDGSFATSDLFAPHPTIPNAWRYHSRADSQLTLITGKKFDPAPVEGSLVASSDRVSEVLIFGNGRPYPGALLFRSVTARDDTDDELIRHLAPVVEGFNVESQTHARIPRNMLVPMPFVESPLEKSSKGTVLRGRAEDTYREQIGAAYEKTSFGKEYVPDEKVPHAIAKIVESIVGPGTEYTGGSNGSEGDTLTKETDLFAYGVDSVGCVQIRHAISHLLPQGADPLPLTVVEDSGCISRLSDLIVRLRRGESGQAEDENEHELLQRMVDKYSVFKDPPSANGDSQTPTLPVVSNVNDNDRGKTVLLTGPTGLLGAHILSQLLENNSVSHIFLLIRGATAHAAQERVLKSLRSRNLPVPSTFDSKVTIFSCKLSESNLGLSDEDYTILSKRVDVILHLAWSVNFLISLTSLASTHLSGLQNLLNLALSSSRTVPPKFFFCSSTASVSRYQSQRPSTQKVPEEIVQNAAASGPTGYARSKLAAELICQRCGDDTRLRDRITVIRVGQLSGNTSTGTWNRSEAYPLMLAGSKTTGVLPDLNHEFLAWVPVDVAAECFVEAASLHNSDVDTDTGETHQGLNGQVDAKTSDESNEQEGSVRVLHLLNPDPSTTFADFLHLLKSTSTSTSRPDVNFEIVPPDRWLETLEGLDPTTDDRNREVVKLLSFWKDVYAETKSGGDREDEKLEKGKGKKEEQEERENTGYEMKLSFKTMPSLKKVGGPLENEYLLKVWDWVMENV